MSHDISDDMKIYVTNYNMEYTSKIVDTESLIQIIYVKIIKRDTEFTKKSNLEQEQEIDDDIINRFLLNFYETIMKGVGEIYDVSISCYNERFFGYDQTMLMKITFYGYKIYYDQIFVNCYGHYYKDIVKVINVNDQTLDIKSIHTLSNIQYKTTCQRNEFNLITTSLYIWMNNDFQWHQKNNMNRFIQNVCIKNHHNSYQFEVWADIDSINATTLPFICLDKKYYDRNSSQIIWKFKKKSKKSALKTNLLTL